MGTHAGTLSELRQEFPLGKLLRLIRQLRSIYYYHLRPRGNAALAGASALLFSPLLRKKCTSLAQTSYHINLAAVPDFQARFLDALAV